MADFLDNLIARGKGDLPTIGPRPVARYEYPSHDLETDSGSGEEIDEAETMMRSLLLIQQPQTQNVDPTDTQPVDFSGAEQIRIIEPPEAPIQAIVQENTEEPILQNDLFVATDMPTQQAPIQQETVTEANLIARQPPIKQEFVTESNTITQPPHHLEAEFLLNRHTEAEQNEDTLADQAPSSRNEPPILQVIQGSIHRYEAKPAAVMPIVEPPESTIVSSDPAPIQPTVMLPQAGPDQSVEQPKVESSPTINVTIGRIEIRANQPTEPVRQPVRQPAPKRQSPVMSLADYLEKRNGGGGQ